MAIDVGTKRIGVAQTDLLKTIASPVGTFSPDEIFKELHRIVRESPVEKFVVGWPLTPNGEEGTAVKMVQEFITKLEAELPNIPIIKVDESYTSNKAKDVMIKSGMSKKKRSQKECVDKIAAALILQQYLENQ